MLRQLQPLGALIGCCNYGVVSNCLSVGECYIWGDCVGGPTCVGSAQNASFNNCYGLVDLYNSFIDDYDSYSYTITDCLFLTDEEMKSQTLVDLLNTGLEEPVWQYNEGGYPTLNIK